jgi:N-carbamoylputrescine amidase
MKLKIAMAQLSAGESRDENLRKALKMMEQASAQDSRLICFPEVGFDRFFPQKRANPRFFDLAERVPGPITQMIAAEARRLKLVTIASLLEEAQPGEYYDSAVCIDSDGALLGQTRMTHTFEGENYNEKFYYGPGNTLYPVYKTEAGFVGIAICQDSWFPEVMRALAMRGAELIVVPTAESCPMQKYDWYLDVLTTVQGKAPAINNGLFVGVANRVGTEEAMRFMGSSYVVSPFGRILRMANNSADELLVVEIDTDEIRKARQTWPLLRDRRPETYGILLQQWGSKVEFDPKKVIE